MPAALIAAVLGYLVGSVPVAVLVARGHRFDPRDVGDRNPGYWNVKEQLGPRAALPVFVGDTAKGSVAAAAGLALGDWPVGYVAVAAAMIGHAFPVFAGFRGGRSVLTWVGGTLVVAPVPAAAAVGVLALTWAGARSFAAAARVGVVAFPVAQLVMEGPYRTAATGALMCIIGFRFATAGRFLGPD